MSNVAEQNREGVQTIVIGGGQAGLAAGYHLARLGLPFIILDARERIGDAWRQRWDSLRLFTPAAYDSLPGLKFPAGANEFPTKDEMADYLEAYARHFDLPVRTGAFVERVAREGGSFIVTLRDGKQLEAENVVVAMANYQKPRTPDFAGKLASDIVQLHSSAYRNEDQLQPGPVLLVGAGNSGAEIGVEVARRHETWLSGKVTGEVPFRIDSPAARLFLLRLVLRVLFHRVMTVDNPLGRRMRKRILSHAMPLLRVKSRQLASMGVKRVPRTVGAKDGMPLLEDGRVLEVANVIWCTGFEPGFSWIELPVFSNDGVPLHEKGEVAREPGLYFTGLHFVYAASSGMVQGTGRDGERIAKRIAKRMQETSATVRTDIVPLRL